MTFWVTKARAVAMSSTSAVLGERGSANKTAAFWEASGKTRLTHRVTMPRATEAPKCTLLATLKQVVHSGAPRLSSNVQVSTISEFAGGNANLMDENVDPNAPERAVCPKRPRGQAGQAFDDEWLPDEDGIEHVCSADDSTDDDVDDDLDTEDDISMAPNVLPDRERRGRANRRCIERGISGSRQSVTTLPIV
mmetsp:Transcript_12401/g.24939  ORF Transcript_12401/g.24939 Transcript_12401/m.24939 type:complete len:193 (+) Transcript_12401:3-581(+)